jgi:hypothetical protein
LRKSRGISLEGSLIKPAFQSGAATLAFWPIANGNKKSSDLNVGGLTA